MFVSALKGNPGGPKGRCRTAALSAEEARQRVLTQGVALTKDGRRTIVCGIEALYHQLLAKALNGDVRAATLLLKGGPAHETRLRRFRRIPIHDLVAPAPTRGDAPQHRRPSLGPAAVQVLTRAIFETQTVLAAKKVAGAGFRLRQVRPI